ncbi:MAG: OmpA family protein [Hyphomicrobiales bacterium]|nr:OmpA family protein [Hyphomicrobiales bacterium]
MSRSRKAMIEARKARVPLARVAVELNRSDQRVRRKVAGAGAVLVLGLIAGGALMLHQRPLEAVFIREPEPIVATLTPAPEVAAPEAAAAVEAKPEAGEREPHMIDLARAPEPAPEAAPAAEPVTLAALERKEETAADAGAEGLSDAAASAPPPFAEPVAPPEAPKLQIVAAAPARDIVDILKPREDTTCTMELRALAEKAVIHFPISSVIVAPEDPAPLRTFAEAVRNCPHVRIDVGGHTDKTGEQLLNLQMSWQRAENVIKYLRSLGVDTAQFSPVGFSATRPLSAEQTGLAQAKNRRVEFILR